MNKIYLKYYIAISFLLINQWAISQITISGPVCVLPGTVYQYNIQGSWDSATTMQVCLNGGTLSVPGGLNQCTAKGGVINVVFVTWNTASAGSITVSSSKGNAVLNVNIISALNAGTIDTGIKTQLINSGTTPLSIFCSVAAGGSCSPFFDYQWQVSMNALSWTDIPGATTRNLNFSAPITETTYFRRRTRETVSGTIAYSDVAMVGAIVSSPTKN